MSSCIPYDILYFDAPLYQVPGNSFSPCSIAEEIECEGGKLLDAAVAGSTPQAQEGSLVIFVGGDKPTYDHQHAILETLGKSIFYIGPNGMGTTMKMVVNTLLGLGLQAVVEAVAHSRK